MQIYLTHIGRMALKQCPLLKLPNEYPNHVSIHIKANQYLDIECDTFGVITANYQIAGFYAKGHSLDDAKYAASIVNMEIVAVVDYQEY